MSFHPDITAALAETRVADLHNAAARGRHDSDDRRERSDSPPPSVASVRLDAYPRLCGLPVTIDRLTAETEAAAAAPPEEVAPVAVGWRWLKLRRIRGRRRRRLALTRQ
ncbi:MAG TPA: hypothetical protein VKB54_11715 [Solirubrobacteraceae bacterium]|nr:hypothetical protein [Solirubrobacteraceae bacterium]